MNYHGGGSVPTIRCVANDKYSMPLHPVLIAGKWRPANASGTFHAENPATGETLPDEYPISDWQDCGAALAAAATAAVELRSVAPERIADSLTKFADAIEARCAELVEIAHQETALVKTPRLQDIELPRTTGQLRQAAVAAAEGSWALPTIDSNLNIRSYYAAIGPVCIFGPNNFPFAFNAVSGGDFAAAIAAGNPVIAKAHPSHPGATRILAEQALRAVSSSGLPPATVQLLYHMQPEDGLRFVSDPRVGATAFTGSRAGGLRLKAAADAAGKPIYLEMSSINPVVILPGALKERGEKIADEFTNSSLLASGQFCTNPGLLVLLRGDATTQWLESVKQRFEKQSPAPLLSAGVARSLSAGVAALREAGARLVTGGAPISGPGYKFANTLLAVDGPQFLAAPDRLQQEAFGNAALAVIAEDEDQAETILEGLEGNLTGSIYSDSAGSDDALYTQLAPVLRSRVGRLLNDKMPTGVAVSAAMNHGGPFPSTGHPGFTAVGLPASMRRFAMLECFDNVRRSRLPEALRDENPNGRMWRWIDGRSTQNDVES